MPQKFNDEKDAARNRPLSFLLSELDRVAVSGKLDAETHREILANLTRSQERDDAEREEEKRQAQLRLGRRLLLFFGSAAFAIGIGFLFSDYYRWFRVFFEFMRTLADWFMSMPAPARAGGLLAATALLFWAALSRVDALEKSSRLLVFIGLGVLLVVDSFKIPDWLFNGSFTVREHLLAGLLLLGWGYYTSFKTIVYAGLFFICGWLGGGAGYGFACYFLWMEDPLLFLPFSLSLLSLAWWIDLRHNRYVVQPIEIVGLNGLFLSLLILSIWGYDGKSGAGLGRIGPIWFILLMTLVASTAIAVGIKFGRRRYYGFGVTFLAIDLYTRFYEVFSGWLPRPVFWLAFGLLSLWGGRYVNRLLRVEGRA